MNLKPTLLLACLFMWVQSIAQTDTVINKYAAVLGRVNCLNTFVVDMSTGFLPGDTILVIQMKGVVIDTSNTPSFGDVLNYQSGGNYEYNVVKSVTATTIELKYRLRRSFQIPNGKVQFVKIPGFANYATTKTHTAMAWNGSKGGVFAINVVNTLTLNNPIDLTGKGFAGASSQFLSSSSFVCNAPDYYYPPNVDYSAKKGEGFTVVSLNRTYGKGKLGNGGGGGNATNSGGGGGGNAGSGGFGGNQWAGCSPNTGASGIGGLSTILNNTNNKVFLGGGGGAGHINDHTNAMGGNGGGLIFITAGTINTQTGGIIRANGADGLGCTTLGSFTYSCGDGMGGGGGGGGVVLKTGSFANIIHIEAKGGKGADMIYPSTAPQEIHGPGGGGGGGFIWVNQPSLPISIIGTTIPGLNGVTTYNGSPYGATSGIGGQSVTGLVFNFPALVDSFVANNITASFTDSSSTTCYARRLFGSATVTTTGIASWLWLFGGSNTSTAQNPTFNFGGYGTYPVSLIAIDSNGCRDTVTRNIVINQQYFANAGPDTVVCQGGSVVITASGGTSYLWTSHPTLSGVTTASTTATPIVQTSYIVTATNAQGCTDMDTVVVNVVPNTIRFANAGNDTTVCIGGSMMLHASGGISYSWVPSPTLTNGNTATPTVTPAITTDYIVQAINTTGCLDKDTVRVTTFQATFANAGPDQNICIGGSVTLNASGGTTYNWNTNTSLSTTTTANPIASPTVNTTYIVTMTNSVGCIDHDTVAVTTFQLHFVDAGPDTSVCEGGKVLLSATGGTSYQWDPNTTLSVTTLASTFASPLTPTVYYVAARNAQGCRDRDSVRVSIFTLQFANAGPDVTTCTERPIKLMATGGATYTWTADPSLSSFNTDTTTASPIITTSYSVTARNADGCIDRDTVLVTIVPGLPLNAQPDLDSACANAKVQLSIAHGTDVKWSPGTGLSSTTIQNPIATINQSIIYTVKAKDSTGCLSYDTVEIRLRDALVLTVSTDGSQITCDNNRVQLFVSGADTYGWTPTRYVDDSTSASPFVSPSLTSTFTVTGTDIYGCVGKASVTVQSNTEARIVMPNAFTPNNDGRNDKILPKIYCDFNLERFEIFDRWGRSVFFTNIRNSGWDGTLNGKPADLGTFYYFVKGHKNNGDDVFMKGDFILIR